jgi:hypothetical protein
MWFVLLSMWFVCVLSCCPNSVLSSSPGLCVDTRCGLCHLCLSDCLVECLCTYGFMPICLSIVIDC